MDPTDLEPTRSVPSKGAGGNGGEDWLADVGDVDWDEPDLPAAARGARRASGGAPYGSAPEDEHESLIHRRRLVAAIVAVVVVGLAILIPVLAFGGGGSSDATEAPPVTTTTPPVTTTTPSANTTPTTPTTSTTPKTTTTTPSGTSTQNVEKLALAEGQVLKLGSNGSDVTQLQQALKALGHDPGAIDGAYGATTQAAVTQFQTSAGIKADGIVGPETQAAINNALSRG